MKIWQLQNQNNYFSQLEACINDICSWMTSNLLKLKQDKTVLIIFTTKQHQKHLPKIQLKVGDNTIESTPCVKNLGIIFNTLLWTTGILDRQVVACSDMQHWAYTALPHKETCKTMVNAVITARLDYGNCLLY